jgi:hypothetical protein
MIKSPASEYQVAIQGHWDGERDGNIRALGLIDDGGWRRSCR